MTALLTFLAVVSLLGLGRLLGWLFRPRGGTMLTIASSGRFPPGGPYFLVINQGTDHEEMVTAYARSDGQLVVKRRW